MKARRNGFSLRLLGIITLATVIGLTMAACSSEATIEEQKPQQLTAPLNLQISGKILTWNTVSNANGYTVDIDGTEYSSATNSYSLSSLTTPKTYAIKVKAIGYEKSHIDSEWSVPQTYRENTSLPALATPRNLKENGIDLTWETVDNAERIGFSVEIDGVEYESYSFFSLLNFSEVKTYTIRVMAIGDNINTRNSEWSSSINYIVRRTTPGLVFSLIDGGRAYSVSKGAATAAAVVIPSVYNGLPVTTIVENGFQYYTAMTSVIIGNSVTTIGDRAFDRCGGLTSVTIGNNVTSIGQGAFSDCSGLTSVTIPDNVTYIGRGAFIGCDGLTSITIPFVGCALSSNYDSFFGFIFGASGYYYQSTLIPASLKMVVITGGEYIRKRAFDNCISLTSVTILDGVGNIGEEVFYDCSGLTSITIPNSVTFIGERAFSGCTSLTSVTIPNRVTWISSEVFSGCSSLTSVIIPNSVTFIGERAFSGCSSLTSITIPNSVTHIVYNAFEGSGLTSINVDVNNPNYSSQNGILYNKAKTGIFLVPRSMSGSVTIPDSVMNIGSEVFSGCSGLTNVIIPNSVTSIGDSAFYGCTGLTSVIIPNSVTSIGSFTFSGCSSLTSVTFATGSSLSSGSANFGYDAFPEGTGAGGGSLRTAYSTGGAGTYTRAANGSTWTKQ